MKWGVRKDRYTNNPNTIYKNAIKNEPRITRDVSSSVIKNGCQLHGLNNRLKTVKSITRKAKTKQVKDAVRYTAILSEDNFVKEYENIKKDLSKKGYKEIRCKNYFEEYKKGNANHKSVQCNYKTRDGYIFEIQYQTKSSQKAKDKKVPLYEEVRNPNITTKRKGEIIAEMSLLAEQVKDPDDISKIKSH